MTSEFAKIGVPFERVPAVDASDVSPIAPAPHLTKAEVACFLSHRKCWQMIADGNDQHGAVFEDDAVFSRDASEFLLDDGWIPRDADIVKVETTFNKVRLSRFGVAAGGHSIARLVGDHMGAGGYVLSKGNARKLLRRTKRVEFYVDHILFSQNTMPCALSTVYQLMPAICTQVQFVVERNPLPTLIQINQEHRPRGLVTKIHGEIAKTLAHCRNRTFWGTRKVDFIPFVG